MAGWFTRFDGLPRRFEQLSFGETNEYGIQRAGFEAGIPADVIPVFPFFRFMEQGIEDLKSLW